MSKFKFLEIQKKMNDIVGQLQETESAITQAKNAISEYKNRLDSLGSTSIDEAYKESTLVEGDQAQINESIKKTRRASRETKGKIAFLWICQGLEY